MGQRKCKVIRHWVMSLVHHRAIELWCEVKVYYVIHMDVTEVHILQTELNLVKHGHFLT